MCLGTVDLTGVIIFPILFIVLYCYSKVDFQVGSRIGGNNMADFDERFHIAAAEGKMDVLRGAAKRDCNKPNDLGMTPTLIAASKGNMAALRLLVSRGGNPDICDNQGYTALHFAALNGNISVVTFLVSFGCNIWGLTNDERTALQLAKENEHHQIADMLDEVFNEQAAKNQGEVLRKRKQAMKDLEERRKKINKMYKRTLKKEAKQQRKLSIQNGEDTSSNGQPAKSISSSSGKSSKKGTLSSYPLPIGSQRNVVRSVRDRDPNIQYGPQMSLYDDGSNQQTGSHARQGRREGALRSMNFGNAAVSLGEMMKDIDSKQIGDDELVDGVVTTFNKPLSKSISNGSAKVPVGLQQDAIDDVGDEVSTPLELFLAVNELSDYLHVFLEEDIDLKALMLLTEKDLADLKLGLGPRKKILQAMENRKRATQHAKVMTDSFV